MIGSAGYTGIIIASALLAACTTVNVYPGATEYRAGNVPAPAAYSAGVKATTTSMDTGRVAPGCVPITKTIVASGSRIFMGAGNCSTCHGQNAKGTPLAPDLTDKTWLHVDGSYPSIVGLIHTGVPKPMKFPAPMPPMGGAALSETQDCTVGAYVYSLTHPMS